ncbi:MAG: TadE/TadG family type IV pilus assembly protein [Planctomycetota bacterium]
MNRKDCKRRGIATVELALILPLLFLLVFGVIDFGRLLLVDNEITNVSREAANLAWRGEPFPSTIQAMFDVSGTSQLENDGFIIMSRIERDQNNNPVIVEQRSDGLQPRTSRVGAQGGGAVLPVPQLPRAGQQLIVAEVFLNYTPVTPLGALFGSSLPTHLYDAAYFY